MKAVQFVGHLFAIGSHIHDTAILNKRQILGIGSRLNYEICYLRSYEIEDRAAGLRYLF